MFSASHVLRKRQVAKLYERSSGVRTMPHYSNRSFELFIGRLIMPICRYVPCPPYHGKTSTRSVFSLRGTVRRHRKLVYSHSRGKYGREELQLLSAYSASLLPSTTLQCVVHLKHARAAKASEGMEPVLEAGPSKNMSCHSHSSLTMGVFARLHI